LRAITNTFDFMTLVRVCLCYFSLNVQTVLDAHAKILSRTCMRTHTETEGKNTKRWIRVHRISEFAVYLGAFAVARGKTQTSAVWWGRKRWEGGNRRSGFAPVVSEGSERRRTGDGGEMEKGVASGL